MAFLKAETSVITESSASPAAALAPINSPRLPWGVVAHKRESRVSPCGCSPGAPLLPAVAPPLTAAASPAGKIQLSVGVELPVRGDVADMKIGWV
jgi:hypothetical protein